MNDIRPHRVLRIATLSLAVMGAIDAFAATRIDLAAQRDGAFAKAKADMRPTKHSIVTVDGSTKVKYQQYHQGVRIWGEAPPVARLANNGAAPLFENGTLVDGIAADLPSVKPKLSSDDIRRLMHTYIGRQGKDLANAEHEDIELVIRLDKNNEAQLVYLASTYLHGMFPTRPSFIINANTGDMMESWEGLAERDAHGPGGNEKMGKYIYGQTYKPLEIQTDCSFVNENVTTIDMRNGTASITTPFKMANCPATGIPYNDQRPINGAYSPENDGHAYGGVVFNMYRDWYGIRPLQQKLIVRVHYGTNYQNAFWDGRQMTFGDGGSSMYPLVSLGVMAHEVSHGVTQQNSGLIYRNMSGGINEAFSDMAAQAGEEYFFGKATLLIGGEIVKAAGKALRYMLDPEKDGRSIGHASKYYDGLNVHYSSGVYNKAFALLTTMPNWSARKAFEIFLIANQLYWESDSTFNEGACGVIQAARDKGYSIADVINVFQQVGVSCVGVEPPPVQLTSGTALLNQQFTAGGKLLYSVIVPSGASFLAIRTGGGSGDANVYVKFGAIPTTTNFDASSTAAGNAEYVLIKAPSAGVHNILVTGNVAVSGMSVIAVTR